jgi:hypothetical protein
MDQLEKLEATKSTGGTLMDRRRFIRSVAVAGTGAAWGFGDRAWAEAGAMTKRFAEQRWALDNIIRANGIDWDQPRSIYLSAPCGVEANADFAAIRARVQKMADIGPAFESTAKRREAKARAAEEAGNTVTARDNWYMAAIHYGAAEWPYDDSGKVHVDLHKKKPVEGQVDPGLVPPAARLQRWQGAGGNRDSGNGQLQGDQRRACQ